MDFHDLDSFSFMGKKVLVRLDLNVPLKDGEIIDDTRIKAALPMLRYLIDKQAKIAVISHLGRPKGRYDSKYSLRPVGEELAVALEREILLLEDYQKEAPDQVLNQLGKDQILLYENLRFHPEEEGNSQDFAKKLSKGIDYFINDGFGCLHRAHASVVGVPKLLPSGSSTVGFLVRREIAALETLRRRPQAPFTLILGGAKVSDKIGVILKLLDSCHHLLIGGAMAYTFLKQQGHEVGKSLVEEGQEEIVATIYRNAAARKVEIHLPVDHVAGAEFSAETPAVTVSDVNLGSGLMGMDIGPETRKLFASIIAGSQTVFWNGPMGCYEWPSFAQGSLDIAEAIAYSPAYSFVGGGDSAALLRKSSAAARIDHISTGGGASLEYLEGLALPGLKVLSV